MTIPLQETVSLVCLRRSPEVSVTRVRSRVGHIGCAIEEAHTRRIVSVRPDPFGVFVGGRAIVTGDGRATPRSAARPSDSLEWLDEIDA